MAIQPGIDGLALLFGRVLFGSLLAVQGSDHFLHHDEMVSYARDNAVPAPRLAVVGSGTLLILGGAGVALGVYPTVAAGLLTLFFAVVTPNLYDFWAVPDREAATGFAHFVKSVELLVASMAFAVLGQQPWPYALNVGI